MKKNLQNAMTNHFQNMVGVPQQPEDPKPQEPTPKATKRATAQPSRTTAVMNEPIVEQVEEVVPAPAVQAAAPVPEVPVTVQQPLPEPEPVIQTPPSPVNVVYEQPVAPVQVAAPVQPEELEEEDSSEVYEEPVKPRRQTKKSIPLMPDEKSSGVLHIRLGELRSYVDFMTQSGKISYQQYISNLIEQDYEKNKDLYLKYKSFMEQLNF